LDQIAAASWFWQRLDQALLLAGIADHLSEWATLHADFCDAWAVLATARCPGRNNPDCLT
jgi:hypothetical protein